MSEREDRPLETDREIDAVRNRMEIERIEQEHEELLEKRRIKKKTGLSHAWGELSDKRSPWPYLLVLAVACAITLAVLLLT